MSDEHANFHSTPAFREDQPAEIAARDSGDTVTLTIDGKQVTVPAGTNVLEAAKKIGFDVPAFCYHPGLPIAAVCRQCLVKVEKAPKPMPACQAICTDGMVVDTQAPEVVDARRQMLEFTLVNHPIDCPICDKAGECVLQDLYFNHNAKLSRVDVPKVRKRKVVDVGPHIVLDQERCILCTRCIRVCDEVAGKHELTMALRGDHEVLTTAPGAALENDYSINTVDVCPVGALTSKHFRFSMRVWELLMTPSICNGCATGCNIEIHHKQRDIHRLVPRYNRQVNKHWMCDDGRLTYREAQQDRVAGPLIDGLPASWDRALATAADKLQSALAADAGAVGVVLSPQHTNEANFALAQLAREHWKAGRLYVGGKSPQPAFGDDILKDADVNPNRRGVQAILGDTAAGDAAAFERDLASGALKAVVILGGHLAVSDDALATLRKLDATIVITEREIGPALGATVLLAVAAWAEEHGTITNRLGLTQRLRAAFEPSRQVLPAWKAIARLGRATGATVDYTDAEQVFSDLKGAVAALSDAEWGKPVPTLQLRFAHRRG